MKMKTNVKAGRIVFLVGEPGIGRTRTAEEFARRAPADGAEVLVGRCDEGERAPAFWPWVQALHAYATAREPGVPVAELGAAATVAAVVPEGKSRLPELPPPPLLDPEPARFRFFDGVTGCLRRAAVPRSIVLVLDDLHGADEPSLLLLQFRAQGLREARVLVVGAYRDVALGPEQALAQTLGELVRERGSEGVQLAGFAVGEVAELIETLRAEAPATAESLGMPSLRRKITALQAPAPEESPPGGPHVFRRDGDYWTITYAGTTVRLHDMRGLHYLAQLLRAPGREFHSSELVGAWGGLGQAAGAAGETRVVVGLGDAGPVLDARARAEYRQRLADVREELEEAERLNDLGRAERARAEIEALGAELGAAARGHRVASHAERARLTVTKGIKAVLGRIAARLPALGAHLAATVRRGYFCAYVPDPRYPISWMA